MSETFQSLLESDYLKGRLRNEQRKRAKSILDLTEMVTDSVPLSNVITERMVTSADSLIPTTDRLVVFDPTVAPFDYVLTAPGSPDTEYQNFYFKNIATNGNAVRLMGT